MKALLDLNIWLDLALRQEQFPESAACLKELENQGFQICFPALSYTTLVYLIEKFLHKKAATSFVDHLLHQHISFLPFTEQEIAKAKQLNFKDHEGACVCATAILSRCDLIITRNEKDFIHPPIKVIAPKNFIKNRAS
jgi:predicted nucleic acid-binding protein